MSNKRPNILKIPDQFQGVWVWDPSFCSEISRYPFIKLKPGGYSKPKPPLLNGPTSFSVQAIAFDQRDGRRLRATFPNSDKPSESVQVTLALSEDGKTVRWREQGAANDVLLYRCG